MINKSDVKIEFQWKIFGSEREENLKKNQLIKQLEIEEEEKKLLLKNYINFDFGNDLLNIKDDFEDNKSENNLEENNLDTKIAIQKQQKKAELLIKRKYKTIKKAIEDDLLLFQDDIFTIEPLQGIIWPNGHITITITMNPNQAKKFNSFSFCNISCLDERLMLEMEGEGLGPKAFLSTNFINIGDIFVNEK